MRAIDGASFGFDQGRAGEKIIVFMMTCASVDFFSKVLAQLESVKKLGVKVEGLHGRMVQKRRTAVSGQMPLQGTNHGLAKGPVRRNTLRSLLLHEVALVLAGWWGVL